ncbi:MAG: hypothetical protein JXA06_02050 [Bacteroidetes bacterium]|nr:hypothetical protein [Bacteroidota bacterium]
MPEENCETCKLRVKYDNNPKSLAGRFWRWHINFCPGWKKYFTTLPSDKKEQISRQYNFTKYQ